MARTKILSRSSAAPLTSLPGQRQDAGSSRSRSNNVRVAGTTFTPNSQNCNPVFFNQASGPRFTVSRPTAITEIGAYMQNDLTLTTLLRPLLLEIRPALPSGLPDPNVVLFSTAQPVQEDGRYRYESVSINARLEPGNYFVIYRAEPGTEVCLLDTILGGELFPFQPGPFGLALSASRALTCTLHTPRCASSASNRRRAN